ncbi:hypothetical protein [Streptomyces sp. NEAU-W12]|uniref:hypothetical protein n=1 Tax=Streptomyces sp. NEAU-W12 TaxID=2994668 RepID=UPI00224A7A89|nr:hypothetical protein [Streptomyces sp. NEAU-W12]MCX2927653.1 hypothetical protein [Streptomyces sp. NEAU-W12]
MADSQSNARLRADAGAPISGGPAVLPFQTCDGCERAFRAPEPGHCRDCRRREEWLPAAA